MALAGEKFQQQDVKAIDRIEYLCIFLYCLVYFGMLSVSIPYNVDIRCRIFGAIIGKRTPKYLEKVDTVPEPLCPT
jgi:hypothetical protein